METERLVVCSYCGNEFEITSEGEDYDTRGDLCCSQCIKERLKDKLSRNERYQLAADAGFDTWDDYNGDR